MTASLTYVYCLVRSARRPSLRGAPAGMPGAQEVRLLEAGPRSGLWLVVSSVPARDYGEAALQRGLQRLDWVGRRAVAHEAVVEHFLTSPAVLPMQLFTLFTSDARAIEHVAGDQRRLTRILDRIERQLEWGVRLTWDERVAQEAVEKQRQEAGTSGAAKRRAAAASGVSYLVRKRDLLDINRGKLTAARAAADRFFRIMRREASASRRRTATEQAAPGSRLLLDAAFLVPARRTAAFRAAVRRHAKPLDGSGAVVSLTGPWPPYNFI